MIARPVWGEATAGSGRSTGIAADCPVGRVYTNSQTGYISARFADRSEPALAAGRRNSSPDCRQCCEITVGGLFCWRKASVSIEEKVIGIVSDQLDVPKEEISRESSFVDDLKADSLDIVELVMALEDEFDVKIPDEDYDKIKTVGNAITYIEGKS